MTDYNYISKGNKSGTILGKATTNLVGFYGITPVDQPAALTAAVSTLTYTTATAPTSLIVVSATATLSSFGFATTADFGGVANAVKNAQVRIAEIQARLEEVGIIAGGTVGTTTTATQFDYVGYGGDEGDMIGQYTSSLVGFYGIAPVDQLSAVTTASAHARTIITATITIGQVDVTISVPVSDNAGYGWGYTAADVNQAHSFLGVIANIQTRIAEVATNLAEAGLIAGGTAATSADYDYLSKGNDTGTIFGKSADSLLGFWGTAPCDQAAGLTTADATISFVSAVAATYAIASMVQTSAAFKMVSVTAAETLVFAVQNAYTRLGEIEAALEAAGLQAA